MDCWKRPKWSRGFLWVRGDSARTPSAMHMEIAPPLPDVPISELSNTAANAMIASHLQLFHIVTPIDTD